MPARHIRLRQLRLQSPWAWLLAIPLLLLTAVFAIVFLSVVLVSALVAALFGRSKPPPQQPDEPRIIDAEYMIESDSDEE